MSIVTGYKLEEKTKKIPKQWGLERFFIGNVRYIKGQSGLHFDSVIVNIVLECKKEIRQIMIDFRD